MVETILVMVTFVMVGRVMEEVGENVMEAGQWMHKC